MIPEWECESCEGQGFKYVQCGPDDVEKEICEECNGTGIQIPDEVRLMEVYVTELSDYPEDTEEVPANEQG